ncbi:MAG: nucleotidyl transferase AbiEii/AbiGii toxin family protein [Candidatus Woesearchaeota archaeon]
MINKKEILQERDDILTALLYSIAEKPLLSQLLILQGGGALHFIYSSPRYSTDLDFAFPEFAAYYNQIIYELSSNDFLKNRTTKEYNPKISSLKRNSFKIKYSPQNENGISARIEVYNVGAEEYKETKGKFNPLLVETPKEISADKIVATIDRITTRGSLKATDLFDIDYIAENFGAIADAEKVQRKLESYEKSSILNKENVDKVLLYINDRNNHNRFLRDIKRTFMPDVFDNMKFDKEFFEKTSMYFERLKKEI